MTRLFEWPALPGEAITAFLPQTQEPPTMATSTARLTPMNRQDVEVGAFFRMSARQNDLARFVAIPAPFEAPADTFYSIPVRDDGSFEPMTCWNRTPEMQVYVETDERRSAECRRRSLNPQRPEESADRLELPLGAVYITPHGDKCVVTEVIGSTDRYYRVLESEHTYPTHRVYTMYGSLIVRHILPDRRSGEERRAHG